MDSALRFSVRQTVTIELPLPSHVTFPNPEQIILKIGTSYHDVGSYCFAIRSEKPRSPGRPRDVALDSFLTSRSPQVVRAIRYLDQLKTDAGKSLFTVRYYASWLRQFVDWADQNGFELCLAGGQSTEDAFLGYCKDLRERYRQHEIGARRHNSGIQCVRELLEAITDIDERSQSAARIRSSKRRGAGSEPGQPDEFAHVLALNQSIFDGLSKLVLSGESFPYRLELPRTLGWNDSFLWIFPLPMWRLPPHLWGAEREKRSHWAYDFEHGQLATVEEVAQKYRTNRRHYPALYLHYAAVRALKLAQQFLDRANQDKRHWARVMLGMIAVHAFLFLFVANTGCNEAVAREIETDGSIDARTLSQNFRSIKYRAQGKLITLATSVAFLPTLRRFIELRHWLLKDTAFPYLFFTLGPHNAATPAQLREGAIDKAYHVLRGLDPRLPLWGSRKIRATVADYYQRRFDASVTAKILQNSPDTVVRRYNAGSPVDHRVEMSLFLEKVAEASSKQQIELAGHDLDTAKPLEGGGHCRNHGQPAAMAEDLPVVPDCKHAHGCLFCHHRILMADEEDARKIASAAFVMEQVISGPMHEAELRPLIRRCDDDLERIAAAPGCREMVNRIRIDVFENGNLTDFFADKFQLFLELGAIV